MRTSLLALACLVCAACGPRYSNQTVESTSRFGNPNTQRYYTLQVDPNGLATRTYAVGGTATAPEVRQLSADSFTAFKRTIVEADPMSMKRSYDPCAAGKCTGIPSTFDFKVVIDGKSKEVATQLVESGVNPQGLRDIITLITNLNDTFPQPTTSP